MSENIVIAIITVSGSIIGAVIGAFATIAAAQIKENPLSGKPLPLKQKRWASILFGAVVGGVGLLILGIVIFPSKSVCEQIKLTAIPNTVEIKQNAATPEWNSVNYQFVASPAVNAQILMFHTDLFVDSASQQLLLTDNSYANYFGVPILGGQIQNLSDGISADPSFVKTAQSNGSDHYIDRKIFYVIIPSESTYCELIADVEVRNVP